ncbi:MAG: ABC transporter substrate-binding protein [Anaerolineae bacterium]|nr:ABC transporter substrate-binding protein [Anaerolineae bacterium]
MKTKSILFVMLAALVLSFSTAVSVSAQNCDVTLKFWHHWGGNRVPLMDAQVVAFQEANPGICVETVFLPWDNRLENLLTAISAGDPPDVTMFGRQDLPSFAVLDAIVPLDDYMAADGITADMFIPSEFAGNQYGGKTYMLPQPTGGALNIVWYNKQHFRDAGFDPDYFPETWDELKQYGEALRVGADGFLDRVGIDVLQSGGEQPAFLMWLNADGQDWISDDLRTVTINNPAGVETLNFMKSFTDDNNFGVEEVRSFYEGGAELDQDIFFYDLESIQVNGSWVLFQISDFAPDLDFGIAPVPYGPSGSPDRRGSTYGGWGYMIPQNAAHPDEAWKLVKWLTAEVEGTGACWFLQQQQRPSPLKDCDGYLKDGQTHPRAEEILAVAAQDHISAISPVQPQVLQVITNMTDAVLYGDKTTEDALADAEAEIQGLLDEFWAKYS